MVRDTGDTTKRFDAFRTKPKLSEAEAKAKHGNKYYEFTNIISNKTRSEYFGESSYQPQQGEPEEKKVEKPQLKAIGAKKGKSTFFEKVEKPVFEQQPKWQSLSHLELYIKAGEADSKLIALEHGNHLARARTPRAYRHLKRVSR